MTKRDSQHVAYAVVELQDVAVLRSLDVQQGLAEMKAGHLEPAWWPSPFSEFGPSAGSLSRR